MYPFLSLCIITHFHRCTYSSQAGLRNKKKKIIKRIHHQELYRRIKKNHIHPQNSTIIHGILILSHCNPRQSKDL